MRIPTISSDLQLPPPQCCGHLSSSKAPINKRKEAQKLASWALSKISQINKEKLPKSKASKTSGDDIAALEAAFGSMDAKLN
jgi:hypothetical protein